MPRIHHPHRGSLGYRPKKRASSPVPRIKSWPQIEEVKMLGFCGYKAGMTQVVLRDDRKHSISAGEEITRAASVIEAPPLMLFGVRLYSMDSYGLKPLAEGWKFTRELPRALREPKQEKEIEELEGSLEKAEEVRALIHTLPRRTGTGRKRPEILEYKLSGGVEEAFSYIKERLGSEVRVGEIFEAGELIDVAAVSKGKGFQSPLKRYGVKHLPRKSRKGKRRAGNLGPWHPSAMMWTVPHSGQMGFHHRTEYNKRILKLSSGEDEEITPSGGFINYGEVRSDYMLVDGSIPGAKKCLVRFRPALRKRGEAKKPEIIHVDLESKQGG